MKRTGVKKEKSSSSKKVKRSSTVEDAQVQALHEEVIGRYDKAIELYTSILETHPTKVIVLDLIHGLSFMYVYVCARISNAC